MLLRAVLAWHLGLARAPEPLPDPPAGDPEWDVPPGCPDRDALFAGVARRRGQALAPGQVSVAARIVARGARRYHLELRVRIGERSESRSLSAATCAALVDAAALLVAVAVDESDRAASAEPPPAAREPPPELEVPVPEPPVEVPAPSPPVEAPELPPPAPLPQPTPAPPPPARSARLGGFLRVQGGGELGALPGPTGAVGLGGGLLWRRFRLELQATYLPPRALTRPQARVRASLAAATLLGCARLGRGALEAPICGGLEVGGMHGAARGEGVDAARIGPWIALAASAGVAWRAHPRIALWAALQALAALRRPSFQLRDPEVEVLLHEPAAVSGRLLVGVEARFGDPR